MLCAGVVFVAGIVRGFSGFALSALFMASVAVVLPPVELIPICYVLEVTTSLIMFIGMFTSIVYLLGFGVMNKLAISRGLLLAPIVAIGVLVGSAFFRASLENTYKKFCLGLLIFLASTGLIRLAF